MTKIGEYLYYVGSASKTEKTFEGEIPLTEGMAYNSYLIKDTKTCLLDTVDVLVRDRFLENVEEALEGRPLDYLVIHHLEPDHTAAIIDILNEHPETTIVISSLGKVFFLNFFGFVPEKIIVPKEGEKLSLGNTELTFYMAPMVHWPEVMVSYESKTKTLFSADAFGAFGANEELFYEDLPDKKHLLEEARRYYANICGKYGDQVNTLLGKTSNLDISRICSLHGPIYLSGMNDILSLYKLWANYEPEDEGTVIIYTSIYGHLLSAVSYIKEIYEKKGIKSPAEVYLNECDTSYALSETFKYKKIILISPTYNMGIFPLMENYLYSLKNHNIRSRKFGLIEGGSWAPQAKKIMTEAINTLPGNTIVPTGITIKSSFKEADKPLIDKMIEELNT